MGDTPSEPPPRPPDVQAVLSWGDLPPEALRVAGRVVRGLWRPLLELLEHFRVYSWNGRIRVELVISYGKVTDYDVSIVSAKPGRGKPKSP
jgi:hypothetical protein